MIPFNEYQQWKRTENLALECFNKLYDIGINPESYVQWIYSENFNVNENQIAKYINKSYLFESFGTMMPPTPSPTPSPTPPPLPNPTPTPPPLPTTTPKALSQLQLAMKDPARQAMIQRSLQSLKTLQQSYLNSLKRGGLLGKQADLNKLLGDTINAIQSVIPKVQKANESYNYEKPSNKRSFKESYGSNTTYKPKIINKNNPIDGKLLDEWKKTERLLRSNDINVKTFLKNVKNVGDLDEAFGATLDALGSGAVGAIGGLFSGGFKGMVKGAKAGYNSSLDQGERNSIEDAVENLKVLINAIPDKKIPLVVQLQKLNKIISPLISGDQMGQAEEPKAGGEQQVASGKVEKIYNELLKAFEAIKVDPKKDLIIPSIKDNAMKDEIVKMLKFSVPLKDGSSVENGKYIFKNNKWYTQPPKPSSPDETKPDPDYTAPDKFSDHYEPSHNKRLLKEMDSPGDTSKSELQEVDPKIQAELNVKFPPAGRPNVLLDELKNLAKAEKVGKMADAMRNLHNRLQKEPLISGKLRNYLINLLQGKNESVYFTMDYSEFVSDLTNR